MYIHSEDVSDITYVVDRVRVRVKAIGALTAADAQVVHKTEIRYKPPGTDEVAGGGMDETSANSDLSKVHVKFPVLL